MLKCPDQADPGPGRLRGEPGSKASPKRLRVTYWEPEAAWTGSWNATGYGPTKPPAIVNDPNDWSREAGNPRCALEHVAIVSPHTQQTVAASPRMDTDGPKT